MDVIDFSQALWAASCDLQKSGQVAGPEHEQGTYDAHSANLT